MLQVPTHTAEQCLLVKLLQHCRCSNYDVKDVHVHAGIHCAHVHILCSGCPPVCRTCYEAGACDSLAASQVLVGQLDYFPAIPNTVPALHRLCNMPKVLLHWYVGLQT